MKPDEYLLTLAGQLAHDLTANGAIKRFTTNPELIGAYAEATVRQLVARIVSPLRVSRGTIVYEGNCPKDLSQLDTIVWSPCPVPAIFEAGDFAFVPRGSAMAFLEIKRSNYSGVGASLCEVLSKEEELIVPRLSIRRNGADPVHLPATLGVVCLREKPRSDPKLDKLVEQRRAVVLLEQDADGTITTNASGMYTLLNFLAGVRRRAVFCDGTSEVKTDALATD